MNSKTFPRPRLKNLPPPPLPSPPRAQDRSQSRSMVASQTGIVASESVLASQVGRGFSSRAATRSTPPSRRTR